MCDQYFDAASTYTRAQALRAVGAAIAVNYREARSPSAGEEDPSPLSTPLPIADDDGPDAAERRPPNPPKVRLSGHLHDLRYYVWAAQSAPLSEAYETMSDEVEALCHCAALPAAESPYPSRSQPSLGLSKNQNDGSEKRVPPGSSSRSRLDAFSIGAYNSQGCSSLKLACIDDLGLDVVGLTELHGQHSEWESPRFICAGPVQNHDSASGGGFRLSQRASTTVIPGSSGLSHLVIICSFFLEAL